MTTLALLSAVAIHAHQFEKEGFFYNILDRTKQTVEITYKGSSYDTYPERYTGKVVIPSSVTFDGKPYSVTQIGISAFQECTGITSITIPNTVETLEYGAFTGCTGLTSITIPSGVTNIAEGALSYCTAMTKVVVDEANSTFDSRDNCNAIINTESNTLVYGCQSTIIPNSVAHIGKTAFTGCKGLTSIEIPSSVITIGDAAFCECKSLTNITIPNGVTTIGYMAFYYCDKVKSITLPRTLKRIGDNAFQYCMAATKVNSHAEVPPTCGDYAFDYVYQNGCTLYIPKGSKSAYSEAFPWRFFETIVDSLSGIDEIVTDNNAPTEYFNINGTRVENPENGIFIKRQGKNVEKVIIK